MRSGVICLDSRPGESRLFIIPFFPAQPRNANPHADVRAINLALHALLCGRAVGTASGANPALLPAAVVTDQPGRRLLAAADASH